MFSNLWLLTGSQLSGLTVMQQCIHQMKFKNVDQFKKWLVGMKQNIIELLSTEGESVSVSVFV